jgi:hypothetical protein
LTGKQPFASDNYMGVIQNIIHMEIPTVSEINPGIPDEVEAIVSKALNKDRDNRYQSAREFREGIEDYLGILRLNELSENMRVLLETPTSTQVLYDAAVPDGRPRKRSNVGLVALTEFLLVASGSLVVILDPSLLDRFGITRGQDDKNQSAGQEMQLSDVTDSEGFLLDLAGTMGAENPPAPDTADSTNNAPETSSTTTPTDSGTANAQASPAGTDRTAPTTATTEIAEKSKPKATFGWLSINATPSAEIYVDGVYKGDTPPPMSLKLTRGDHKVECRHPRHEPYTEVLKITTGELSRRNVTLKKLTGIISLATQEGAEFYVDGKLIGTTPIMKPIEVDVGQHVLTIKKEGFHLWNSEVTVEPKKVMPLRITLSPRY